MHGPKNKIVLSLHPFCYEIDTVVRCRWQSGRDVKVTTDIH